MTMTLGAAAQSPSSLSSSGESVATVPPIVLRQHRQVGYLRDRDAGSSEGDQGEDEQTASDPHRRQVRRAEAAFLLALLDHVHVDEVIATCTIWVRVRDPRRLHVALSIGGSARNLHSARAIRCPAVGPQPP